MTAATNIIDFSSYAFSVPALPSELTELTENRRIFAKRTFRIALLIPMCGSAGIWAPSCIASAQVAVSNLNKVGGICGRPIELIMIDSALEAPTPVDEVINSLIELQAIDAIVGMHISAVRQKLSKIVNQRVPYIYTPLYEGGENTNGIFAIGDTPDQQLGPALDYLSTSRSVKNWALIGNDYVWPRSSNYYARQRLTERSANVVYEKYLPFGLSDMSKVVEELGNSGADAVLLSLVGQDAVTFNREFGSSNMHKHVVRLSCAIEENGLLAIGAENLYNLYSASSYFGSLATRANTIFKEEYYMLHGDTAPVLNALGQSTYEGIQFLAGLLRTYKDDWQHKNSGCIQDISFSSIRRPGGEHSAGDLSIYLAEADGMNFSVIKTL